LIASILWACLCPCVCVCVLYLAGIEHVKAHS